MKLELDENQVCLICYEIKPIEQGEVIVRFGSYIEFTCYECPKNCGACGFYFGQDEADKERNHLAKFCDASSECDICGTKENLLNEKDKRELSDDWAGVNFYEEICRPCWAKAKELC